MRDFTSESGVLDYDLRTNALLLAASGAVPHDVASAIEAGGLRGVGGWTGFAGAAAALDRPGTPQLIVLEAAGAEDALAHKVFARVAEVARERNLGVVAAITPEQIDAASAHLLGGTCQLLCDPTPTDRVSAYRLAANRAPALNAAARAGESARLQRLNEEVARIADTLARLTRGEESMRRGSVRDPGNGYRGPDPATEPLEASAQEIRAAIRARRMRAQFFAGDLFADPAWDMLLDLFAAELEQRRVSVSSLCIAAAVPPTTALRWIGTMHDSGLFQRQADPSDRRRAYIALSAKGLESMRSYVSAVKRQGLAIV